MGIKFLLMGHVELRLRPHLRDTDHRDPALPRLLSLGSRHEFFKLRVPCTIKFVKINF
jgi:hypothetical protein